MTGIKLAETVLILPIPSTPSRQMWTEADRCIQGHEFKKAPEVLESSLRKHQVTSTRPHINSRKAKGLSPIPKLNHDNCKTP